MYKGFLGPFEGFAEKLLNIKTARFYGKVFIGCPPYGRGTQEIAERQNIYILEGRCCLCGNLTGFRVKNCAKQKRTVFAMRCYSATPEGGLPKNC